MEKLESNKKRLGQKTNLGFYKYDQSGRKLEVDETVYAELGLKNPTNPYDSKECIERGVFAMINECCIALDTDKIVDTPNEVDLAMIMGTGFPPFRGGLTKYADHIGAKYVSERLAHYTEARSAGGRLSPSSQLKARASSGKTFYN